MKKFFEDIFRMALAMLWVMGFLALTFAFVRVVSIAWKG